MADVLDISRDCAVCGHQGTIGGLRYYGNYYLCDSCQSDAEKVHAKYRWTYSKVVRQLQLVFKAETR